jgi:hydrogenase maturation protease
MNEWEWQLLEDKKRVEHLQVGGGLDLVPGSRVRLRPRKGGDVLDLALAGKLATVEAIEQDYEGNFHLCVVLDDDPGRELGLLRQPGHRFFFSPEEVEPLPSATGLQHRSTTKPRILVAGIGNIFRGDDAFGVEVIKRMAGREFPDGVRVADFGIRGFDLALALQNECEITILVDACPRGDVPGTLYLIEPDLAVLNSPEHSQVMVEAHEMNPMNVLRLARTMNGSLPKRILLVGCEPASLGGEEGQMGLTGPVSVAVEEAVIMIESLIEKLLNDAGPSPEIAT